MGAHANEKSKEGNNAKADGQLAQVARAGPFDAKQAILLLTAVADALGEVTAFEVRVDVLPITRWVGYLQHLALAAFREAIMDNDPAIQDLSP